MSPTSPPVENVVPSTPKTCLTAFGLHYRNLAFVSVYVMNSVRLSPSKGFGTYKCRSGLMFLRYPMKMRGRRMD